MRVYVVTVIKDKFVKDTFVYTDYKMAEKTFAWCAKELGIEPMWPCVGLGNEARPNMQLVTTAGDDMVHAIGVELAE